MSAPDPPRKWKRVSFDEASLNEKPLRLRSEVETDRDLAKPIQQLICDCHEETENNLDKQPLQGMARAQKRMVSMMGQVAISNNALAWRMEVLTWVVVALAFVGVALGSIQVYVAIRSMPHQVEQTKAAEK